MARSTPVIALVGAGILVVAIGAVALRGTDGTSSTDDPTDAVGTPTATDTGVATPDPTETTTPDPTGSPTDAASPSPIATATGTETPGDDDTEGTGTDPTGTTDDDGTTDDGDADDTDADDNVAMGPTDEVQDTPNTGGGSLALLGAAVAAGAVMAGRRPRD